MGFFEEFTRRIALIGKPGADQGKKNIASEEDSRIDVGDIDEVCREVFEGPLEKLPTKRSEVYEIYGSLK